MIFRPNFDLKNKNTFLLEVSPQLADQLESQNEIFIEKKYKEQDFNDNYNSFISTEDKVYIIQQSTISNTLMILQEKDQSYQINGLTQSILNTKEFKTDFNKIILLLETIDQDKFLNKNFLTIENILQQIAISKNQLLEFLKNKKIPVRKNQIIYLKEIQLAKYLFDFLEKLKICEESDFNKIIPNDIDSIFQNFDQDVILLLKNKYIYVNQDGNYAILLQDILRAIIQDILNGIEEPYYEEFIELLKESLLFFLKSEYFYEQIKPEFEKCEFQCMIKSLLREYSLIIDYNDYKNSTENQNIKIKRLYHNQLDEVQQVMQALRKYKQLYDMSEIESYFKRFFINKNQYEKFLKKNFIKIIFPVSVQKFKNYEKFHPECQQRKNYTTVGDFINITYYKMKNLHFN